VSVQIRKTIGGLGARQIPTPLQLNGQIEGVSGFVDRICGTLLGVGFLSLHLGVAAILVGSGGGLIDSPVL
jgi:hypothetical protein